MAINEAKLNEFMGKAVGDMGAAMSAALVVIGDRLGIYKAMAALGPATTAEIGKKTGIAERYVREWTLNQAAGGYVSYDAKGGKYFLTEEQAFALANDESPAALGGAFEIIGSMHRDTAKVQGAYASGKGIAWGDHDACLFCGTEKFFAASYRGNLVGSWIPALEGVKAKLERGIAVADVGCGHGASTIIMAKAFPNSKFTGFDFHGASIECARAKVSEAGLKNVTFEVAEATGFALAPGGYGLVTCFDCLHDMGDPVGCGKRVRQSLAPGGTWMVVEPNAADTVEGNLNPVSRVFSAASAMICVPASVAFDGPALGACAGPAKLTETIKIAGFASVRVATTTPFNLILEARA
ncbi:MAG: class I SAM-dependent methyltransferase [Planctomycetota bacterium]